MQNERRFRHVAVFKGGSSEEREVSLRSGAAVARGLREAGYAVTEVDVQGDAAPMPEEADAVFIALHGCFGEDGGVQALLDERRIPYTGSGAAASRAAMDKRITRARMAAAGIPVPEGVLVQNRQAPCPLPFPVVVKPPSQGSSLGCHVVQDSGAWTPALDDALRYENDALVERFIAGRELTVGVVGDEVLPVIEIIAKGGTYDYRAKYIPGHTRYLTPAPLSVPCANEVQALARAVFVALGARGFGRIDFRLDSEGRPFVLELNTIPGFTETSLLPKAAASAGIAFSRLCERILNLAQFG